MKFTVDNENGLAIFHLHENRLDATNAAEAKSEFLILCQTNIEVLILDFSEVTFCDSSGLSAILLAERQLRERDGGIIVVDGNGKVRTLFEIAKLTDIIPLVATIEEARDLIVED
ncbi:MAG: STAS domain-containing protein [Bacteroidota bacterium]|jgi:anti-anti-sigma factor|nr:STAS domain-containing protein [Bacteroidota bacterium]